MQIDPFKQRTLDHLASKQEDARTYPISETDLTYVDRCTVCGSKSITLLTEVFLTASLNFFSTSVCDGCLYTFRSVSPSFDWFKKCWGLIATGELQVFNPEVEKIRRRRYEAYNRLLSKYAPGGRLLDVGAAYGTGSKVFQDLGYQVEALEPEDDKANYIRNFLEIPVFSGSLDNFEPSVAGYDLVLFAHCLEHLDDPTAAIAKMRELVNPSSGTLYVEVPNIWNFVSWSDALYLTHKSNFTEPNVVSLLENSGFEVLETTWFQHTPEEPWDLGIVAKPVSAQSRSGPQSPNTDGHTVRDVQELYRKGLALTSMPAPDKVLRYSVPYIEQFYCTLKLDTKRIVEPVSETDFIAFEPV